MNCFECTHKSVKFADLGPTEGMTQVSDKMYVLCAKGNTDICADFYKKNGSKPKAEVSESVACFEATEGARRLDRLLNLADGLLQEVKKEGPGL